MLQFCQKCDNMTSLKTNLENKVQLLSECMQCGFSVPVVDSQHLQVFRKQYTKSQIDPQACINQFTHLDPTLPRLRNKVCVNEECLTHNKALWKVDGLTVTEVAGLMGISSDLVKVVKMWSTREWLITIGTAEATEENESKEGAEETKEVTPTFPISHTSITPFTGEVVYIKYDSENMKFMYVCTVCNIAWKNE